MFLNVSMQQICCMPRHNGSRMIYLAVITIIMPLLDDLLLYGCIHNELKLLATFNEVSSVSFIHSAAFSDAKSARFVGLATKGCCREECYKAASLQTRYKLRLSVPSLHSLPAPFSASWCVLCQK